MGWRDCTLTIASGATESAELSLQDQGARRLKTITIINPDLAAELVVLKIADKIGGTYQTLNDGYGNDVRLLSNKSQVQAGISGGALKLVASAAVAADRVFLIKGAVQSGVGR